MKMRYIFVVISILLSFNAFAKPRHPKPRHAPDSVMVSQELTFARIYADSLAAIKLRLDSMLLTNDSLAQTLKNDMRYYRLFVPLAYDGQVTNDVFSSDEQRDADKHAAEIEDAIMRMYLEHPELVKTTVNKLRASDQRASKTPSAPVRRKIEVVKDEGPREEAIKSNEPMELFVYKPNFWKFSGDYNLQFMQTHMSENWYQSGESNLAALANVVLQLNYDNKKKIKIDNKLEMKLGFQTAESDKEHYLKTSSDLLRYTGKFGVQATKNWYYTFQALATTQFAHGYKSNDKTVYSDFLSPLTVNLSLGMDYSIKTLKGKLTGSAHIAPLAYNWKYTDRNNPVILKKVGIEEGHNSLVDYGSQFTVNLQWKPSSTFKWTSRIYGYTTYKRVEFECENTLAFTLSKYITTNLYLYPRFDDAASTSEGWSYWQFKEYFSLGFSYSM